MELDTGPVSGPELAEAGQRLAEEWADSGLRPGDRVGLWLPNGRRYLDALAACASGAYVAVSVNTRWTDAEARTLLSRTGARWLRTADADEPLKPEGDPGPLAKLRDGDRPFVIFTTSGTTSQPKMVLHGQRSIVVHAHDAARGFGYKLSGGAGREPGPVLVAMPLCGVFGLTSFTAAVAGQATIIMPSTIDPVDIAHRVERQRVWAMNGSDDLFHRMLAADGETVDLASLEICGYGRFNTSLDGIVERAEQRGMVLTGLYGMSEVQALYSVRDVTGDPVERQKAGGTVVSPDAEARVVDDELQLRGPSLFAGYLAEGGASIDETLTATSFTDDGWFRTGDAAEMEPPSDGRSTFIYRARMGDVLRLGGFLVAPSEIESVLIGLPGIRAAQVVSVDRPTGARPVAFITGPGSDETFDEQAAIAHCATHLAKFKRPIRVIPIDRFPTTPSANGTKIQKVKLREMAAAAVADTP